MAEAVGAAVGLSIVSKLTELLVEPTIRQFRYVFCFKSIVKELDDQKENLASAQDRVQQDVAAAGRRGEEIYQDVKTWETGAKNIMEEVEDLEKKITTDTRCFRWCPNLFQQYKLGRKATEKTTALIKTLETRSNKLQKVGHKAPVQSIDFLPSNDFSLSNSSAAALQQIMEALKDDKVNMTGLYGMPGVGKTTLVKQVGRKVTELKLYDQVLIVVVSQTPNVMEIQDRVIDDLALEVDKKTKEGRASLLLNILTKKEEKVLIILDDVWDGFGLEELNSMGIPFDDAQKDKGWKVLLTTRSLQVCTAVECQRKVILDVFSKDEAWELFKIKANLRDEDSALYAVARKIAEHCKQLPLAIAVVGKTLRGKKTTTAWEGALQHLSDTVMKMVEADKEVDNREKNVYACIKMSYNYLGKYTKSCFLLCSLFPEDYDIPFEDLTRYAVGWLKYQGADLSLRAARDVVTVAIEELKDTCLLLNGEKEEHVKMHDLVRDVAIRIAAQEYGFMVKAGTGLTEWPWSIESFEGCTAISLMGNTLKELPKGLVCPQLKVLLLELGDGVKVPDRFFEGMKAIEVLSLKGGCLSFPSLEFLTNLQSLELIGCKECKDLSSLSKLQRLKLLCLHKCSIDELPDEIGELKELMLLDLTSCMWLGRIPVNLIGRLKKLEELLIGDNSFKIWDDGGNAGLTELKSLSHLAVLLLIIPKVECIPRDFVFPKLRKYEIRLGKGYLYRESLTSKIIVFDGISATSLNMKTFELLFPTVSQFYLDNVKGLKNIIMSSDQILEHEQQQSFLQELEFVTVESCGDICTLFPAKLWRALKNLRSVEIRWCHELEEVFELDEEINEENVLLLSSLTKLKLRESRKLKCIWKVPTRHVSLQSLIRLELQFLDKLKFIFTPSLAQSLQQLEILVIRNCRELAHIVTEKDDGEIIPESLCFSKLKTLHLSYCSNLKYVLPVSMAPRRMNLEEIIIVGCGSLNQVFGSREGDAHTSGGDGTIVFPQLKKLMLSGSRNLSFFGPNNVAAELPSLQHLQIEGHNRLGNILAKLRGLTNLEVVIIRNYDGDHQELTCLWNCSTLKSLTALELSTCPNLSYIFPPSITPSLVQLKSLKIAMCNKLEEIIASENKKEKDQILLESHLQSLWFPNLSEIQVHYCNNLKRIFSVTMVEGLPQLQKLILKNSSQLVEVFGQDDKATAANVEIKVPNLLELSLEGLPSLVSFTPTTYKLIFPRLETLNVEDCPKMATTFSVAANDATSAKPESLKNLRNLSITHCGIQEVIQVTSFVSNSGGRHEPSLLSMETLTLSYLPDLRCICKGLVLKNLTTLEVTDCHKLRYILPSSMIASLVVLKILKISSCDELEQIIAKDEEVSPVNVEKEMEFPNLLRLSLENLPRIVSFTLGCYDFVFPRLELLKVSECPKLATKFTTTPNGSMSAQSEISQVAEDSNNGCSVPTSSHIIWTRDEGWEEEEEENDEDEDEDEDDDD